MECPKCHESDKLILDQPSVNDEHGQAVLQIPAYCKRCEVFFTGWVSSSTINVFATSIIHGRYPGVKS